MEDSPESSSLEERILTSLRRIIRAVDVHSRQLLRSHHLTAPQLTCLRHLRTTGPIHSGELARAVSLSQATVTGILDRLEDRGLVARHRSTVDRRCVLVELTDAGRELVATAPMPLHERFCRRLAELPEKRRDRIREVLDEIVEMMEVDRLDAAPVLDPAAVLASAPESSTANPPIQTEPTPGG